MEFINNISHDPDNIWCACSDGELAKVQELIEKKNVDVNIKDDSGYTPM